MYALAGCEGEQGVWLTGLRVLLQTRDEQAAGVVVRTQVVVRDGRRPVRVPEEEAGLAIFGGADIPGDGRAVPVGKVRERRPLDARSRLQLVDPHPLGRSAKTETGNRPNPGLGPAF